MGRPTIQAPRPTDHEIVRFWTRVSRGRSDECWLWTGGRNIHGYGIARMGGHSLAASRWAWIVARGPIPDGRYVLHTCDVRLCCNPGHLFVGSQSDNMQDMIAKGRRGRGWHPARRGEVHQAAKLSDVEVGAIREAVELGAETQRDIAKRFGISHTYVGMLARREKRV